MKLFHTITVTRRGLVLFVLFVSLSTPLSALSIFHWARFFFRGAERAQQEELFVEECGEPEPEQYSEKKPQISSRKRRYVQPRSSVSLQSIGINSLQPYIEKAEKRLALDEKKPSKNGKHFAQGFIKGVQSSQEEGCKTKSHKKSMSFLKPYISRSGSAKGFSRLLIVSYAFGDFLANLPKQQIPKEVRGLATSWKKLSFQSKGKKIGHFIASQMQK